MMFQFPNHYVYERKKERTKRKLRQEKLRKTLRKNETRRISILTLNMSEMFLYSENLREDNEFKL